MSSWIIETEDYERGGTQKDTYGPDEVVEVPCPLCASDKRKRIYTEHGSIGVSQCRSCSLLFTSPRIAAPEEIYWGEGDKYVAEARLIFAGKAAHHRDPNYIEELELIEKWKPKGRFLDVGCNMGFLLRHARERGWDAVGCEPSPALAKIAREKFKHNVYNCWLSEMPEAEAHAFDVVALSDVFEHVANPIEFLGQAARALKPDGVLYLKVPNGKWNLWKQKVLQRLGKRPRQGVWDSYEHVVHYTDRSLARMLQKGGFELVFKGIGKPIQPPAWQQHVGQYFQYPSPFWMDPKRIVGREAAYRAALLQQALDHGEIGPLAPNIVAIAKPIQK